MNRSAWLRSFGQNPRMTVAHAMTAREWALLLALSVLWGASFLFVRIAVHDLAPLQLVFLRMAVAAVVMLGMIKALGLKIPADSGLWRSYIVMGLLGNIVPFTLLFWGERYVSAGLASILGGLTPFFTLLISRFTAAPEPLSANRVAGLLCGFSGVAVLGSISCPATILAWF